MWGSSSVDNMAGADPPLPYDIVDHIRRPERQLELKNPLRKRLAPQLDSEFLSDVSFDFPSSNPGKKIIAHRILLASASQVFATMFSSSWSKPNETISIYDMDYDSFYGILKFAYTDSIDIDNCVQAAHLLYGFKKYLIDDGADYCRKYITKEINIDDAVSTYQILENKVNEETLCRMILMYIGKYPEVILQKELDNVDASLMCAILGMERINTNEVFLIKIVSKWVQKFFENPTEEDCRNFLRHQSLIDKVRFLSLTDLNVEGITYLIEPSEVEHVKTRGQYSPNLDYALSMETNCRHRIFVNPKSCLRVLSFYGMRHHVGKSNNNVYVHVHCDKTIILCGFKIPSLFTMLPPTRSYRENLKYCVYNKSNPEECYEGRINDIVQCDTHCVVTIHGSFVMTKNKWYVFKFMGLQRLDKTLVSFKPAYCYGVTYSDVRIVFQDDNSPSFLLGLIYFV